MTNLNQNDLRYVKTEKAIKLALLRLLEKQPIEAISIKALCGEAQCSRNAFYQHYDSKFTLCGEILKDILQTIDESTSPIMRNQSLMGDQEIQSYSFKLLKTIDTHKGELAFLLSRDESFLVFLSKSLYQSLLQHYRNVTDAERITEEVKLVTKYYCCGIAGFIEKWLKDDEISLEEAQRLLDACTRDTLRHLRDLLI